MADTARIAGEILSICEGPKIFAIYGDLGAGKTTFVQAACKYLNVHDTVKSPTFSIVNEYHRQGGKIFHFDFYRIERLEEAYDLGYEEYFDSGEYCFIEWPELIAPLLPPETVHLVIEADASETRTYRLTDSK